MTEVPGISEAEPSVLVIERSACGVRVSVSVAELLAATGSVTPAGTVTVAVLTREPVAEAAMVPVTVKVAVPEGARSTGAEMFPDPEAGQAEPTEATQVQVTPDRVPEKVSETVAPITEDGPRLVAVMV